MTIQVTSDALGDLRDSYAFYEKQTKGLGSYFRQCIERDLIELRRTAGIHRKVRGYHHMKSRVFQSILFYQAKAETATVMAILDGRIDPSERDRILHERL